MRLLTFILIVFATPAWATTYYAGNSGSNANSCATAQSGGASAKRNMANAITCANAAGDDVIVETGYTGSDSINSTITSGTAGNYSTVTCSVRRTCTISGSSLWAFRLQGATKHHIRIEGFVLQNTGTTTVALHSSGGDGEGTYPTDIQIVDNEIVGDGTAPYAFLYPLFSGGGSNNQFINNTVHECADQCVYFKARDSIFRGNEVYNSGLQAGNTGQSITIHSSVVAARNNLIEENIFHDCAFSKTAVEIGGSGQTGNVFRRNLIYNCGKGFRNSQNVGSSTNNVYDHNTVIGTGSGTGFEITATGSTGTVLRNNVALNWTTNITTTGCGGCTQTDNRTTGTLADLFTAPGSNNYTLKAGSAAINDGTDISLAYNGAAPDHGAFESLSIASAEVGLVDATSLILTFTNNVQPPLLPASGITGFTVTENASPITVSSCARTGDNIIDCTLGSSIVGGRTVLVSYSGGNVTDSSLVGNTWNQPLHTITDQAVTNNVGGGSSAVLTQTYYRFHHLLGAEDAPVVLPGTASAVNTPITINPGGKVRLRLKVACTAADCDPLGMFLRYSLNSGGYSTVVPDAFGADNIRFIGTSDTSVPTNGTATTEQLTSDHASMVACALVRTSNAIPSIDLSQNSETECEYVVEVDSDASEGDTYDFRLYSQTGTALSAYTVTPRITVQKVASGGR